MLKKFEQAIRWATEEKMVDIITMSFGYRTTIPVIENALRDAFHRGSIIFAAASNSGLNPRMPISFPASSRQVICVHSSDGLGNPSLLNPPATADCNFATLGMGVRAAWPIHLCSDPVETTQVASGTSVATPIAAGIAALILEYASQGGPRHERIADWRRLHHCDEMRKVFSAISRERDGYKFVVPSVLFDYYGERMYQNISSKIIDILNS